jgi:hypothetical protein
MICTFYLATQRSWNNWNQNISNKYAKLHRLYKIGKQTLKKFDPCQALVAHACNPCYSGGRDQENCSSKPAQGNSS